MNINLGVIMDPITKIDIKKDTTFKLLLSAQKRGWKLHYFEQHDLYVKDNIVYGYAKLIKLYNQEKNWVEFINKIVIDLTKLDVILIRKDPPFDMNYLYTTQLLELVENTGVLIINKPDSLRKVNEKLFILNFPQCCPPTLVSSNLLEIKNFLNVYKDIIIKPLEGMGGKSVFRLRENDTNINVIIEIATRYGKCLQMIQSYIPLISGDKRILMIDGKPIPYVLARFPKINENRANLAVGGIGRGVFINNRENWICEQISQKLMDMGLIFVGIDIIGGFLTEINVTSPTCVQELDLQFGIDISSLLINVIENKLYNNRKIQCY